MLEKKLREKIVAGKMHTYKIFSGKKYLRGGSVRERFTSAASAYGKNGFGENIFRVFNSYGGGSTYVFTRKYFFPLGYFT